MSDGLTLTGYVFSVYTRAARIAMAAKGVAHAYVEIDPFDPYQIGPLHRLHPFGRVPVLDHHGFHLWETQAILDYVDTAFEGPALMPDTPKARARMRQVMGVVDSYLYWSLVRQAFSNAVFLPLEGEAGDQAELDHGMAAAPDILDALEQIANEGLVLNPTTLTLADCHLWPMLDYFAMIPEGAGMISDRPALAAWANVMAVNLAAEVTKPDLSVVRPAGSR
ncbi:glutathione S-transferase family protein [Roseovarius sp. 2305UL8-3]|uniref:glutathione S-transferase family protein n=1 Tax=Roseovarius conchicola TaxID=3121636 RepID=UPI0035281046